MSKGKKGPVTLLQERVAELEAAHAECEERHLRAMADFDNSRKRVLRDSELQRRAVKESVLVGLLDVLDNFERAVVAAETHDTTGEALVKGIELIHRQLRDVLAAQGLEEYSCLGEEFDPNRAEATGFIDCGGQGEANRVVEERCKGYACDGRVIRPARVVVTKAVNQVPVPETPDEGNDRED